MKKGIVVILLLLALVLLVSPGIIGRLAERSVDDSFQRATNERSEFIVSASGFERGWFTSAGQHRVELREADLYDLLQSVFMRQGDGPLPALLIDTRLDHGLVPVASLNREHGSLLPGLGNAVSSLRLEFADGSVVPLPGKLYSTISLTGELQTRLELPAGSLASDGAQLEWGDAQFLLTSDARSGRFGVTGALQSLAVESLEETVIAGRIGVDLDLVQSGYGYMIGPTKLTLASIAVIGADETTTAGPFDLQADSRLHDGRLAGELALHVENTPLPAGGLGGNSAVQIVARFEDVDAAALGRYKRNLDAWRAAADEQIVMIDLEQDLMHVLAAGLSLHFDQLDIAGPFGQITSRLSAKLAQTPADDFGWAAALLALEASADLSLPAALVDLLLQGNPDLHGVIGMGFLQKKGDYYVLQAGFRQGLLNVNGAPMPIPLSGFQ